MSAGLPRVWGNIYGCVHRDKRKKAKAKAKRLQQKFSLVVFANKLNERHIQSESWFRKHWERWPEELYNEPFSNYIPDVLCVRHKYIIEIDGYIHDLPHVKEKDRKKDAYFESLGFEVYRIKAYDEEGLKAVRDAVFKRRGYKHILRRKPTTPPV